MMGAFTVVGVIYVLVAVAGLSQANPWYQHQTGRQQKGGALKSRLEQIRIQQQMLQAQEEREEALLEEMEDLLGNYDLEDVALQLGVDALGRILRPLREPPTMAPIDDCVSRTSPVEFELGLTGELSYRVCGFGDSASINVRFHLPGETTPVMDTTTAIETTLPNTTIPLETTAATTTIPTTAAETTTTTPATSTLPLCRPVPVTTEDPEKEDTTAPDDIQDVEDTTVEEPADDSPLFSTPGN